MSTPPPPELGRGVVVGATQEPPGPWAGCERVRVDEAVVSRPAAVVGALHDAWISRRPVVVELVCDPGALRTPERYEGPVYDLDPAFEFPLERLGFLVWANTYDARSGELVWWHARKLARLEGGPVVHVEGPADVRLGDGTALYIDGGPPDPPALATGTAVVHRWGAELGAVAPAARQPPSGELAADQLAAVAHGTGGARVIAPAGSGKTRVLTERLRHLVEDRRVHPATVTAVAFNTRAAQEMQARCRGFLGPDGPSIRTLNSLGLWICNELGGAGRWAVLDERDARDLVQRVFPVPRHANADTVAPYLDALGAIRLGLTHPDTVEAQIPDAGGLAEGFGAYRAAMAERRAVDFDEQIYRALEILVTDPEARAHAQRRCRRLLVDEFQDLNPAHLLLIRLLCAPGYDCFGVGDDDQVIYGYSGATPAFLLDFPRYFPGAGHHALEVNYRCPPAVVAATRHLLSHNRARLDKAIRSPAGRSDPTPPDRGPLAGKGPVAVVRARGEHLATRCVDIVGSWLADGAAPTDIAVLARVNSALLPVLVGCLGAGIPASSSLGHDVLRRTGVRAALAYLRMGCTPEHIARADIAETIRRPSRKIARNVVEMLTAGPSCSATEVRRLSRRLSGGDVAKLEAYADDIDTVAAACTISAAAALRAVRVTVGLGASVDVLDRSRREADRSTHADDLAALESVATLHDDAATFEPWLREMLSRPAPTGPSVLLSTVHKVKGKEWPRVVVFGATKGLFPHRLSDDEEGERRVFHVALTRAIAQAAIVADADAPSPFVAELDRPAPAVRTSDKGGSAARGDAGGRDLIQSRPGRRPSSPAAGRSPPATGTGPAPRRPGRQPSGVPAVIGLEVEIGGQSGTVVEVRGDGAIVRIGTLRTAIAFGTEVRTEGRPVTLSGPLGVTAGPASATAAAAASAALRAWRSATAKGARVPAYVVLSDADLEGIAARLPATPEELAACRGMGAIRLERYGDEILAVLESAAGDDRP